MSLGGASKGVEGLGSGFKTDSASHSLYDQVPHSCASVCPNIKWG